MRRIIPALILVAVVFAVYAPALKCGFVWDDTALILRDPLIRSWRLIPEGFRHFLFTDATASDFYRPMQRLTYTIDYAAYAFQPAGYHLSSIISHIATALALLLFANELLRLFTIEDGKRRRLAFLVALVWAIHPVHTSAVVYVSGRADPLAAAFGFLGLFVALRSLSLAGRQRWILLICAALFFFFSALSKETGIIFPFLWCAILLVQKRWKEIATAIIVLLSVLSVYVPLRLTAEHIPAPTFRPPISLGARPVVAARAASEYAGLILLPAHLHMERDVGVRTKTENSEKIESSVNADAKAIIGILILAGAIYWLLRSRNKNPLTYTCLILAIIAYLPISGILALNATVAEHWIYLPAAFLFLAVGAAISRFHIPKSILGAVLGVWLVFLGARTWLRTFDWKDQRTFLERTIADGGNSARMLINLAGLELKEGKLDSAKEHLDLALKKEPDQPLAIISLASVVVVQNDAETARPLLNRAINIPFIAARAHELLAVLTLRETGQIDVARFRLAAKTGPPNWSIEKRYVQALDQSGATRDAIAELKLCLTTQWYRAESWQLLSELLNKTGQASEATAAAARAKAYDVHLGQVPPSG